MKRAASRDLIFRGESHRIQCAPTSDGMFVKLGDTSHEFTIDHLAEGRVILSNSTGRFRGRVVREKDKYWVWLEGRTYEFLVPTQEGQTQTGGGGGEDEARAPMPGTLVKLFVGAGESVEAGQVLAILEAMKMEHQVRAPRAGCVEKVFGNQGEIIDGGAVIVRLTAVTAS